MNLRLILSLVIALVMTVSLQAQVDSTSQEYVQEETPIKTVQTVKLKPRLGLGVGSLMFLGDIGRDNRGYHPGSADMAYTLDITNELTSFLDLRLYTVFGTIHIDETSAARRLNMQSQIRSGGFALQYNFGNFMRQTPMLQPYVSAGVEAFEFLSKSDLYDANGNQYFYWSDGSIRNMDESSENASEAILLQRDYVYETDLRQQNLDGFGNYMMRSVAFPVGAGIQFYMTDRFRGRLGTSYHFTMTDLVDNMTSASAGARQGDAKNDRFLFTSFVMNYDLNPIKTRQAGVPDLFYDEDGNLIVMEDSDGDGVSDYLDQCWGTPAGVPVNEKGCPLDSDGDGYADYMDEEPNSPHTYVDAKGIALSDEDIYDHHMMWHDSIPWIGETRMFEEFAQLESDMSRAAEAAYRVRIAREGGGLTHEQMNTLLALDDVQTVEENGEKVFVTGNYDQLPDAIKRKIELEQDGMDASVVMGTNKEGFALVVGTTEMEAEITEEVLAERAMLENNTDENIVKYRVQIGAFRFPLAENIFKDVPDVLSILGDDGLTRYVTRPYANINDAALRKVNMLLEGFEGAFITAYKNGRRISIDEAKGLVPSSAPAEPSPVDEPMVVETPKAPESAPVETVVEVTEPAETQETPVVEEVATPTANVTAEPVSAIDPSKAKFKVLIASFEGAVPMDVMYQLLDFGNAVPHREGATKTNVYSRPVNTLVEAENVLTLAKEYGFTDAVIMGDFNGNTVTLAEIQQMLNQTTPQVTISE
ncbi:MAG: hypothetical protein RL226_344 [Bacteroidota bacterium]